MLTRFGIIREVGLDCACTRYGISSTIQQTIMDIDVKMTLKIDIRFDQSIYQTPHRLRSEDIDKEEVLDERYQPKTHSGCGNGR